MRFICLKGRVTEKQRRKKEKESEQGREITFAICHISNGCHSQVQISIWSKLDAGDVIPDICMNGEYPSTGVLTCCFLRLISQKLNLVHGR